jgi:hypothetical protein
MDKKPLAQRFQTTLSRGELLCRSEFGISKVALDPILSLLAELNLLQVGGVRDIPGVLKRILNRCRVPRIQFGTYLETEHPPLYYYVHLHFICIHKGVLDILLIFIC